MTCLKRFLQFGEGEKEKEKEKEKGKGHGAEGMEHGKGNGRWEMRDEEK